MSMSTVAIERRGAGWLSRLNDYVELTRPRIATLVLIVVGVSGYVAGSGSPEFLLLVHAIVGTLLVAASASAWNQLLECQRDRLMARTARRPLPSGRLSAGHVVAFGTITLAVGTAYLALAVNWLTAALGLLTWALYVLVYTPLKSRTPLNTLVGAVPGALPVLMGWSAVRGTPDVFADPRCLAMFSILFFWQLPHFMAIAWIYREQYRRAGLRMLTVVDPTGRRAAVQGVVAAAGLLLISLALAMATGGDGAMVYLFGAFALGAAQLGCAVFFLIKRNGYSARLLLRATLIYLPSLFLFLV
ncbi:MAG: protoheme IX farnesyltransferase [Pirellulaceae bacterium]|nr:protoheme IX farnesyltransferase [Pirellulaceae bacterium]